MAVESKRGAGISQPRAEWKHNLISLSPNPIFSLLSSSLSPVFLPVSMSPSLWFDGRFSEVNHSRFQAPHQPLWRSILYRAVRVNIGVLEAVNLKDGTWTLE